ncbi:hypothetical protein M427DRAFT_32035 [Gonapodya prolifera JEL478]|uniref:Uncharacterized protein n=1 Tax=Gonapodya prolifera (strain JEL478) TaxID=1344416 RepID=A0A139AGQ1_GONPJ|nr:hypothetical protein M427DRAFT_32035 [Gonapodya prolifera JEL478]|eukprot:KXS15869.1 hypothetical protein M427DRAFT_32035 [Gonapodya prolifera JEL478]
MDGDESAGNKCGKRVLSRLWTIDQKHTFGTSVLGMESPGSKWQLRNIKGLKFDRTSLRKVPSARRRHIPLSLNARHDDSNLAGDLYQLSLDISDKEETLQRLGVHTDGSRIRLAGLEQVHGVKSSHDGDGAENTSCAEPVPAEDYGCCPRSAVIDVTPAKRRKSLVKLAQESSLSLNAPDYANPEIKDMSIARILDSIKANSNAPNKSSRRATAAEKTARGTSGSSLSTRGFDDLESTHGESESVIGESEQHQADIDSNGDAEDHSQADVILQVPTPQKKPRGSRRKELPEGYDADIPEERTRPSSLDVKATTSKPPKYEEFMRPDGGVVASPLSNLYGAATTKEIPMEPSDDDGVAEMEQVANSLSGSISYVGAAVPRRDFSQLVDMTRPSAISSSFEPGNASGSGSIPGSNEAEHSQHLGRSEWLKKRGAGRRVFEDAQRATGHVMKSSTEGQLDQMARSRQLHAINPNRSDIAKVCFGPWFIKPELWNETFHTVLTTPARHHTQSSLPFAAPPVHPPKATTSPASDTATPRRPSKSRFQQQLDMILSSQRRADELLLRQLAQGRVMSSPRGPVIRTERASAGQGGGVGNVMALSEYDGGGVGRSRSVMSSAFDVGELGMGASAAGSRAGTGRGGNAALDVKPLPGGGKRGSTSHWEVMARVKAAEGVVHGLATAAAAGMKTNVNGAVRGKSVNVHV